MGSALLDVICCIHLHSLLHVVESGQIFEPSTPNISFAPWSPKWSAMMLDPFAQLFQHCWGHTRAFTHGLLEGHSHVSQYSRWNSFNLSILWCNPLHVPTLFRVVASICTPLPTLSNKLLTFFRQQCWELLCIFAHSLRRATFGTVSHFLKISIGHNYLVESTSG